MDSTRCLTGCVLISAQKKSSMRSPTFYHRTSPYSRLLLVVLLMAGWTLLGCQILADSACLGGHADDATMIKTWQSNHDEFDQVIQMFIDEKGVDWLPYEWTSP